MVTASADTATRSVLQSSASGDESIGLRFSHGMMDDHIDRAIEKAKDDADSHRELRKRTNYEAIILALFKFSNREQPRVTRY